ncbi:hypothetical protein ACP4OV_019609 [Aristida adscensionis]
MHATVENFLREIASEKPIQFSAQQLARFTLTRGYSSRLGTGGFGTVYRGVLPDGLAVAVKVLHGGSGGRGSEEQFMAEVGTIGRTHHINLMERGVLDAYLLGPGHDARVEALRGIAAGVARGIRYLRDECNDQQKIVHYDIKPGNVLLSTASSRPRSPTSGSPQLVNHADTPPTSPACSARLASVAVRPSPRLEDAEDDDDEVARCWALGVSVTVPAPEGSLPE